VNWEKLHFGRDRDSFKTLVERTLRERRREERGLAAQCIRRHRLQARKSCVADARSYRVARRLPAPAAEPFDWKTLIPVEELDKLRSIWIKKFGDQQFTRWLTANKQQHNVVRFLRDLRRKKPGRFSHSDDAVTRL
jgi:tRNA U38,U39,U40 pseudouridine synthase TruA